MQHVWTQIVALTIQAADLHRLRKTCLAVLYSFNVQNKLQSQLVVGL